LPLLIFEKGMVGRSGVFRKPLFLSQDQHLAYRSNQKRTQVHEAWYRSPSLAFSLLVANLFFGRPDTCTTRD
jgi:hypothetical protein